MDFVSDTWFQFVRHIKTQMRMRVWIFINLVQPIIWLLLFPQIFKAVRDLPGIGGNYLQFLAPGVVVMTVVFGSAWAGMGMLHDIDMGILSKMLATPVSRVSIITSRIIASMAILVVQALIIFGISVALGVDIVTGVACVLMSIVLLSLLGLGFAAFSNGLALLLRRPEPLIGVINFIALPAVFLSTIMMPGVLLPEWLDTLRKFNPVDYAVVGVRSLVMIGFVWEQLWQSMLVLTGWAAAGIAFGTWMFSLARRKPL